MVAQSANFLYLTGITQQALAVIKSNGDALHMSGQ